MLELLTGSSIGITFVGLGIRVLYTVAQVTKTNKDNKVAEAARKLFKAITGTDPTT
jgi:hypothetical protein